MSGPERCRHCGRPIRLTNYALGQNWMHFVPGSSGSHGDFEFCRMTKAEPKADAR